MNLFSILIAILFFGSFLSLPIFSQTAQNPIKLAIIAVDRNGQRSATRTINANEFSFDEVLKNNDKIRSIILMKGKTYQHELEEAKKKYTFDVEKFRSITSDESYILKISNIKRSTT